MLGENPHLTPLESRKQLLLLESELNRALFLEDVRHIKKEIQQLAGQAHLLGSLFSSVSDFAGTCADIGHAFSSRDANEKPRPSWISVLVDGAKAGASLWGAWRSHRK